MSARVFNLKAEEVHIEYDQVIGAGAFSTVYKGMYANQIVAIKIQRLGSSNILLHHIQREITVCQTLCHEQMVEYIGSYEDREAQEVAIVTEYLPMGNLLEHLPDFSWISKIRVVTDIARALVYLHERSYVHRDVKTENVLVFQSQNGHLRGKLCDFGFARSLEEQESLEPLEPQPLAGETSNDDRRRRRLTICGTDEYMAPELYLHEEDYDERVDVYSFGVMLMDCILGQKIKGLFERKPQNLFQFNWTDFLEHVPKSCPPSLVLLVHHCLSLETEERLTSAQVLDWLDDLSGEMIIDEAEEAKATAKVQSTKVLETQEPQEKLESTDLSSRPMPW